MDIASLPALNALLNLTASVLLATGFVLIRRGHRDAHRRTMIAALAVSTLFLVSYLVYHAHAGSVRFQGQGSVRTVYFAILISHTILAAAVPPLAIVTVWRAARGHFAEHRALARWTLPLWFYVSVTGVVIYWMLYRF